MASPRFLSKSRFKLAVECPSKLFYSGKDKEYRDASRDDDFLAMLAEGGYQVGALAKLRYPQGIEIEGVDHVSALDQTYRLLKEENVVLFEPAIQFEKFFIRIDILVKTGNSFELIEVKAKSYNSAKPEIEGKRGGITTGMLPYIQDATFQTWVLQQAFPQAAIKTFLMMPDKSQIAPVDGINQMFKIVKRQRGYDVSLENPAQDMKALAERLLANVCIDQYVGQVLTQPIDFPGGPEMLPVAANEWAEAYNADKKIQPVLGAQCGKCQFKAAEGDSLKSGFRECWTEVAQLTAKDFEAGTVLDVWNFRGKQKLIDQGVYKLSQVRQDDLKGADEDFSDTGLNHGQRQWLQIAGIPQAHDHHGTYVDDALMSSSMAKWKFPYHFIDFETSTVALPFYKNMRPYEPVAFQFSHHIMESDRSVRHAGQFLCTEPGEFPNFKFARALRQELEGDEGTVFMWSPHENTILTKIIEQLQTFPEPPEDRDDLIRFIQTIVKGGDRAMVDLCALSEKSYFHPDTKGSNSIKKVLPALLKASEKLRQMYSQPIYGSPQGVPSLNYASEAGFAWIDQGASGTLDPYAKIKELGRQLLPPNVGDEVVIAEGGAAATAYARLQFESLESETRELINSALLRYCELDTLAMVIVIQGWQELIGHTETGG